MGVAAISFLVQNVQNLTCGRCKEVHEHITKNCIPIAFPERWRQDFGADLIEAVPAGMFVEEMYANVVESKSGQFPDG